MGKVDYNEMEGRGVESWKYSNILHNFVENSNVVCTYRTLFGGRNLTERKVPV